MQWQNRVAFAVNVVLWSLVDAGLPSCFLDDEKDRDFSFLVYIGDDNSHLTCLKLCKERGKHYAALQGGNGCYCDDNYGKHGPAPDSECGIPCTADRSISCGGLSRNWVISTKETPICFENGAEFDRSLEKTTGVQLYALRSVSLFDRVSAIGVGVKVILKFEFIPHDTLCLVSCKSVTCCAYAVYLPCGKCVLLRNS